MQSHYITQNNSTIHYRKFGDGPKLLFCFHGYGREADTFSFLERRLGNLYTIVAIDIPFHGQTEWNDELIVKPKYLQQTLLQIRSSLKKENLKFSLLGFSMGGRIALYLTQLMADQVERLVLLAPDGLNFNFWRWLGSDTWLGNKILHYTIHHPSCALWILKKAEDWKVIHRSMANYVRFYIEDEEYRFILYHRYISMRKFKPTLSKLKQFIRQFRIPVKMMFGSFDRVIPYQGGERFKEGIEEFASMKVVEAGHNLLSEVQVGKIAQLINE
ncbi:MAG: alpha/beta hydrolase [Segetibacter sp.]|nr:alpha/beta hydrolase [Segetibacter sp.]